MVEGENTDKYFALFTILRNSVPQGFSTLDVLRAAEFMLADCIAQGHVTEEVKEKTYLSIVEDVRNFTKTFEEAIYEEEQSRLHISGDKRP